MPEQDPMPFETRLADAFDRLVVAAPVAIDAPTLAAAVATGAARRRSPFTARWAAAPRWAIVLGLLAAGALGVALVAGALLRSAPGPLGGGGNLMVFARGTATVLDTHGATLATSPVVTRGGGCPLLIAGGTGLAASTFGGVRIRGLEPGAATMLGTGYAGGERWSLDGRVLARVPFREGIMFTTFPDGPTGDPVDVGVPIDAVGDGLGVVDAAISPDGATLALFAATAVAQLPDNPVMAPGGAQDLVLVDSATGATRTVGRYERGDLGSGLAWSPNGAWLGFVVDGPDGSVTGWVVDGANGTARSVLLGPADASPGIVGISPDGARVAVAANGALEVLDVADGRTVARQDGTSLDMVVTWGPDGRSFAWVQGLPDPTPDVPGSATPTPVLHVLSADGTLLRDIPVEDGRYAWSPDRSALAVVDQGEHVLVHFPWRGAPPLALATLDLGGVDNSTCIAWTGDIP